MADNPPSGSTAFGLGKSALDSIRGFFNLEQSIQHQQQTILELNHQLERLVDNFVSLSERLAVLEATVKADRETNAEETKRIISDFIAEIRLKLKEAELQAEREKNAQILQLLTASRVLATSRNRLPDAR